MCYHLAHQSPSHHRHHLQLLSAIVLVLVLVLVLARCRCLAAEIPVWLVRSRWKPLRGAPR